MSGDIATRFAGSRHPAGTAHSIVVESAWEPTPWPAVQQAGWAALHAIAKGQRPFSLKVRKDVVAQVAWKQADNAAKREAWLARHPERRRGPSRPRYQVNLLGLTRGESSRITP